MHELANHDCPRLSRPSYAPTFCMMIAILAVVFLTAFCVVLDQRNKAQEHLDGFTSSLEEKQNELVGMQNRIDAVIRQRYKADVARLTAQNKCRELARQLAATQDAIRMPENEPPVLNVETIELRRKVKELHEELAECEEDRAGRLPRVPGETELGKPSPILPKADDPPPAPTLSKPLRNIPDSIPEAEPAHKELYNPHPEIKPVPLPRVTIPTVAVCKCGCGKKNCRCRCCRNLPHKPSDLSHKKNDLPHKRRK